MHNQNISFQAFTFKAKVTNFYKTENILLNILFILLNKMAKIELF